MSTPALFKSRSQRRLFLSFSSALTAICFAGTLLIASQAGEPKWFWSTLNDLLVGMVASGAFAIFSMIFIEYFLDPDAAHQAVVVPAADIEHHLFKIADAASSYKIYVRTGRYFRSKILPKLVQNAVSARKPIDVDVVLLDFRNAEVCRQYAQYREECSFDNVLWSGEYVSTEVLATILAIVQAARENPSVLRVSLSLSSRLSTFRIEGSAEEMLITREDPKDVAYRYDRSRPEHSAYLTEFDWVRGNADRIDLTPGMNANTQLMAIFGSAVTPSQEEAAKATMKSRAPYGR